MRIQVLASVMNQKNHDILNKMNIRTDAIYINQSDEYKYEEFKYKGNVIKFLSFNERGVGLSRNNALMRADADICLFADEDMVYEDNYEKAVIREFEKNPKADMIVFNVSIGNKESNKIKIHKNHKVHFYNCGKHGTVQFAIKRKAIYETNIFFSLLFGGGAKYSCGEDSIFINDCIKKRLQVYASTVNIGYVEQNFSTWFKGYNNKYFIDKGILYKHLYGKLAYFICIQFVVRHHKMFKLDISMGRAYYLMCLGVKEK